MNSEGLKDPFHKRVEMKLRALSDRMSAEKAAASSRSSPYQNADRAAISSRSALCQNTDRVIAPSKSATQASHKFLKEVQPAATLPRTNFYNKGSSVSHVASSNSSNTGKLATRSSVMPNSPQNNAKPLQAAQVAFAPNQMLIYPLNLFTNATLVTCFYIWTIIFLLLIVRRYFCKFGITNS